MSSEYRLPIARWLLVSLGFGLLALLASGGETWAAPRAQGSVPTPTPLSTPGVSQPPGPPSQPTGGFPSASVPVVCVVGGGGWCASSASGDLIIRFPSDAAPLGTLVTIAPYTGDPAQLASPAVTGLFRFLGHMYQVTAMGPDGQSVTSFNPPFDLWIAYSGDDLKQASGDPNNFAILSNDPSAGVWSADGLANQSVDVAKQQVHVSVSHLSLFALFRRSVPPTPAGEGTTPLERWLRQWIFRERAE